jgi:seryl-tRNA synthetase
VAKRGPLPKPGLLFDLQSYCFRREPSKDPARMQMFCMREYVRIGTPEQVTAFRAVWLERGREFVRELGLPFDVDLANDPFFGRAGKIMASSQRDQGLKFELLVPIESIEKPTACLSFNYHQDHFGALCGINTQSGDVAQTACVGFGLERLTLALFEHHGFQRTPRPLGLRRRTRSPRFIRQTMCVMHCMTRAATGRRRIVMSICGSSFSPRAVLRRKRRSVLR